MQAKALEAKFDMRVRRLGGTLHVESDAGMHGLGGVVYQLDDLQACVARGAKSSTSDVSGNGVLPAKRHAAISPAYVGQLRR